MASKKRIFKGFGVVTRQGYFLWQYCRPDEADTRKAYEAHNPQLKDYTDGHKLVKLCLIVEPIE